MKPNRNGGTTTLQSEYPTRSPADMGQLSGVYAGLVGALFFNFFFTEPYDTNLIDDLSDRILAATLLISGLVASGLGSLHRRSGHR